MIVALLPVLTGCAGLAQSIRPAPVAIGLILATNTPNPSATPTPFQPQQPTPTGISTSTRAATATPRRASSTPFPTATLVPSMTPDPYQGWTAFLMMGSDARATGGFRTDVIELVLLQPKMGLVSVVSFPRDLYINIPGFGYGRINTAMAQGGFPLMSETFQSNWGVKPEYYMMTNFRGFVGIVNSLGGIDVNASKYLSDRCDLLQGVRGWCSVGPGKVHMDGDLALWYVRSRYSTDDIDRNRRAQEVLVALFQKLMSLNAVTRVPDLYNLYRKNVETNIGMDMVLNLVSLAPTFLADTSRIRRFAITYKEVSDYITPTGGMVLMPNQDAIRALLYKAMTP